MRKYDGQNYEYLSSDFPVLLATSNITKVKKLQEALEGIPNLVRTPSDVGFSVAITETGTSHKKIAETKALKWSNKLRDHVVITTDGGALIPSLESRWLSVYTGRFAGEFASSVVKIKSLLNLMRDFSGKERLVTWIEALAVARNGQILHSEVFEGATGRLLDQYNASIPTDGFWLSTLLFYPQYQKIYNNLNLEERKAIGDPWCSIRSCLLPIFQ